MCRNNAIILQIVMTLFGGWFTSLQPLDISCVSRLDAVRAAVCIAAPSLQPVFLLSCAVIFCALPCCAVALQILGVHLGRRGLPLAPDVQVAEIAAMTMGFTGADLANLVNEVSLLLFRTEGACGLPVVGPRQSGYWSNEMHTVQYSNCGRGSQTSALSSEPRACEGAQRPVTYPSLSGQVIHYQGVQARTHHSGASAVLVTVGFCVLSQRLKITSVTQSRSSGLGSGCLVNNSMLP
jgi:hypothetical protein